MRLHHFLSFCVLIISVAAVAQQPPLQYERVLLPIAITGEVPGAFGSRWTTYVAVTSTADREITIRGYVPAPCAFGPCFPSFAVPAGVTFFPRVEAGKVTQGALLLVERQFAPQVAVHLRVQDVSRQAQTWGTEIPAVREGQLFTTPFDLLDVPLAAGFRQTLRIYDVDALPRASAVIRFYRIDPAVTYPNQPTNPQPAPDTLLAEKVITLQTDIRSRLRRSLRFRRDS